MGTVRNKAAIQPFLDKVGAGYFITHRGAFIVLGDSWTNGAATYHPDLEAWSTVITDRVKDVAGRDGGAFLWAGHDRVVFDYRKATGNTARSVGLRDYYFTSSIQGEIDLAWAGGTYITTTMMNGGVGGIYRTSGSDAPAWAANAYTYTSVKENNSYWTLTNLLNAKTGATAPLLAWPASTAVVVNQTIYGTDNKFYICVQAGTTGATEPTWVASPGQTTDGTAKWLQLSPATTPPLALNDGTCMWLRLGVYNVSIPPVGLNTTQWPPADWAANTFQDFYPQVTSASPYTWNVMKIAAGGTTWLYYLVGGKSASSKPTFDGYQVIDGSIVWRNQGPSKKTIGLPPAVKYALIHGANSGNAVVNVGMDQPMPGYPYTVDMSSASTVWGLKTELPAYTKIGARSMSFDRTTGTTSNLEGVLCIQTLDDTGIISYPLGVNGREAKEIQTVLTGDETQQRAFTGSNFIPTNEPMLLAICLGINDFGHGNSAADASSALSDIIGYYHARFTDLGVMFIIPPPNGTGGVPVVGDTQYDYFQQMADAAEAAGACVVDCSQCHFGLSAAAAATAGYLEKQAGHPTSVGSSLLANDILETIGLPLLAPPVGVLTATDQAFITAQIAPLAAAVANIEGDVHLAAQAATCYDIDDSENPDRITIRDSDVGHSVLQILTVANDGTGGKTVRPGAE
jgi:hypothetical protein